MRARRGLTALRARRTLATLAVLALLPALAVAALLLLAPVLAAGPDAALAQTPAAQLEGTFSMAGRVTVAVHVKGEHKGQQLARSWSFVPLCSAAPCAQVELTRQRTGGSDTLALQSIGSTSYQGIGDFTAPLRCGGHVHAAGETVPFTIAVQVTGTASTSTGEVATAITATYTNPKRVNHTRCVFPPSHDAAVYSGALQSPVPASARLSARSPGGS